MENETSFNNFLSGGKIADEGSEGINVLSLFDGMSCGQLALKKAGIKVNQYFASEIDKHAIKVTQSNFPDTIQLGDVTEINAKDLPKIDLLIGGSPCQGFSFAGKQLAFDDERSKLFFEFIRLKDELNPTYFFLENVKMKKEYETVISQFLKIGPVTINSALVSAQNRVRLYWTNINLKTFGLFNDLKCGVPQPKDKGILLKDILENDVPEKYYLSDKMLNYFENRAANFNNGKVNIRKETGKATTLTSSMASCDISDNFIKVDTRLQVAKNQDKSNCFTAGGNSGGLHSDMDIICVAMRGRNPDNPSDRQNGSPTEQRLEPKKDGKTNCLTSVSKDNLVLQRVGGISINDRGIRPHRGDKKKTGISELGTIIYDNQKTDTHLTNHVQKFICGNRLRRLTPLECERLQTVPDNYTNEVSDTQRYRMLANGWTVDVIAHFFNYLPYAKSAKAKIIKTA